MPLSSRVMQTAANPTLNAGLYAFTNGMDVDRDYLVLDIGETANMFPLNNYWRLTVDSAGIT